MHLDGSFDHVRNAKVLTKCLLNHREDKGLYYVFYPDEKYEYNVSLLTWIDRNCKKKMDR